jgi:hypothetical protein
VAYLIPFSVFLGVSLSYDIWVVREHLGTLMIIMASFGVNFYYLIDEFFAVYLCLWVDV